MRREPDYEHLAQIAVKDAPPLPPETVAALAAIFGPARQRRLAAEALATNSAATTPPVAGGPATARPSAIDGGVATVGTLTHPARVPAVAQADEAA